MAQGTHLMETVAQIVRAARSQQGWSLGQLAEAARVAKSYLSMIENERVSNPPSAALLERLESALSLEPGTLQRAAGWQRAAPELKRDLDRLASAARRGRELAEWLNDATAQRTGGGKSLDRLYHSGKLREKIDHALGEPDEPDARLEGGPTMRSVPLINKVAAGYPAGFTDLDYPASVADEYVPCPHLADADAFAARVVGESMEPDYTEGDIVVFSPLADVADGCDCFVRLEPDHETTFKRVYLDAEAGEIRLQPLNPRFPPRLLPREQVAGMYRAVWRMSPL